MNLQELNPDIDMDELYKMPQGKDRVISELINHFKTTLSLFPSPVRDDTAKAYVTKALALGFRFRAIKRSIEIVPEQFDRFPSYVQFIDVIRSQSRASYTKVETRETFMEDIQKDINELKELIGEDRIRLFAKAYMKNVFNLTSIDPTLEGCAIALAVHDWNKCNRTKNLDDVWEYGIRTAEEAKKIAQRATDLQVQRIIDKVSKI